LPADGSGQAAVLALCSTGPGGRGAGGKIVAAAASLGPSGRGEGAKTVAVAASAHQRGGSSTKIVQKSRQKKSARSSSKKGTCNNCHKDNVNAAESQKRTDWGKG